MTRDFPDHLRRKERPLSRPHFPPRYVLRLDRLHSIVQERAKHLHLLGPSPVLVESGSVLGGWRATSLGYRGRVGLLSSVSPSGWMENYRLWYKRLLGRAVQGRA